MSFLSFCLHHALSFHLNSWFICDKLNKRVFLCMSHWKQYSADVKSELQVRKRHFTKCNGVKIPKVEWKVDLLSTPCKHSLTLDSSQVSTSPHKTGRNFPQFHKHSTLTIFLVTGNCKIFFNKVNNQSQKCRGHHVNYFVFFQS